MGSVYRGYQRALAREVAIKVVAHRDEYADTLFAYLRREARAGAQVSHHGVVAIFDYGVVSGVPYLVTELVPGESLKQVLNVRQSLTVPEVISVCRQVLDALGAIHDSDFLHRDLKPSNILVTRDIPPVVKIVDFGLARRLSPQALADSSGFRTTAGKVMGTPLYMAPEQLLGEELTRASDLYAFCTLTFEMITGTRPYGMAEGQKYYSAKLLLPPAIPERLLPSIAAFLLRGLERDPKARFASARECLEAFERALPSAQNTGSFFTIHEPPAPSAEARGEPRAATQANRTQQAVRHSPISHGRTSPVLPAIALGLAMLMAATLTLMYLILGRSAVPVRLSIASTFRTGDWAMEVRVHGSSDGARLRIRSGDAGLITTSAPPPRTSHHGR